jgi:hypothetical protein
MKSKLNWAKISNGWVVYFEIEARNIKNVVEHSNAELTAVKGIIGQHERRHSQTKKKKTLEDNANYNIYTKEKKTFNPSSNNQQTKQHKTSDFGFCHKSFLISLFWKLHG